jgi:hypothetical protein
MGTSRPLRPARGCYSETGQLRKVVVCPPTHFRITVPTNATQWLYYSDCSDPSALRFFRVFWHNPFVFKQMPVGRAARGIRTNDGLMILQKIDQAVSPKRLSFAELLFDLRKPQLLGLIGMKYYEIV